MPRQPGTKEARYAHLLSGPVESIQFAAAETAAAGPRLQPAPNSAVQERIESLEAAMEELRQQIAALTPEDRQSLRLLLLYHPPWEPLMRW